MKLFIAVLIFTVPIFAYSQTDSAFDYTEVVTLEGQSKDQLFMKARQWYNKVFDNLNFALRISDKETGELIGKSKVSATYKYKSFGKETDLSMDYHFDLSIYVKDGRYKYLFTNFTFSDGLYGDYTMTHKVNAPFQKYPVKIEKRQRVWQTMQEGLDQKMKDIVTGLKAFMSTPSDNTDF